METIGKGRTRPQQIRSEDVISGIGGVPQQPRAHRHRSAREKPVGQRDNTLHHALLHQRTANRRSAAFPELPALFGITSAARPPSARTDRACDQAIAARHADVVLHLAPPPF